MVLGNLVGKVPKQVLTALGQTVLAIPQGSHPCVTVYVLVDATLTFKYLDDANDVQFTAFAASAGTWLFGLKELTLVTGTVVAYLN